MEGWILELFLCPSGNTFITHWQHSRIGDQFIVRILLRYNTGSLVKLYDFGAAGRWFAPTQSRLWVYTVAKGEAWLVHSEKGNSHPDEAHVMKCSVVSRLLANLSPILVALFQFICPQCNTLWENDVECYTGVGVLCDLIVRCFLLTIICIKLTSKNLFCTHYKFPNKKYIKSLFFKKFYSL